MTHVSFYYDVVCPYSYLETHAVEEAEDAGQIEVEWLPFELRPAPRPLLEPRGDHLRVDWTQHVYRRALSLGVEIHLPRYQPFFCEGQDIATDPEIRRAAERVDLDPDAAIAAAYSPQRIAQIAEIRREAEAAGVRGVPSLLAEDGE